MPCLVVAGIGYGMVVLTSVVALYYNVIIAWALYYMAMSFRSDLPWATCGNWSNTEGCVPVGSGGGLKTDNATAASNVTDVNVTTTVASLLSNTSEAPIKTESSVVQFWL